MRVARSEIGNCTSDPATCVVALLIMSITLDGIREKITPFRRGGKSNKENEKNERLKAKRYSY